MTKYTRRSCNLHADCDYADEMVRAAGGRDAPNDPRTGFASGSRKVMTALHCSTEDCEDCYGC